MENTEISQNKTFSSVQPSTAVLPSSSSRFELIGPLTTLVFMTDSGRIRIGTRGSQLARWQADWVAARLRERDVEVELVMITTRGDQQTGDSIGSLGGTGLFTKEIQRALLDERIDLAVHSLKDLPTEAVVGLSLAAVPPRERCADVLVSRANGSLEQLDPASRIGTGSLRRRAQILYLRNDLDVLDIRGNVETRLSKLDDGQFEAIMLAQAGLLRLGLEDRISQVFPTDVILPAVGQGALGLETRSDDQSTRQRLEALNDPDTHHAVLAERTLLATLLGGCLAPVGAWGRVGNDGNLQLDAVVLDSVGSNRLQASAGGPATEAEDIGRRAATELLEQGAAELIATARQ